MFAKPTSLAVLAASALIGLGAPPALAADEGKTVEDGKYFTADGEPTYNIQEDGTVDWYTYSGYRRYHSECHVCHGPDGLGSSYAPALTEAIPDLGYDKYFEVVASGIENVGASENSVMPAFGTNKNVMCYIDDIYVYLMARADGAIPRGRPQERADKPQAASEYEDACHG